MATVVDQAAHRESRTDDVVAKQGQLHQWHGNPGFDACEQQGSSGSDAEQQRVHRAGLAAANRHCQRIRRQGQRKQERAAIVEGRAPPAGHHPIRRQMPVNQDDREQAKRHVDEKDRPPAEARDQRPAEGWTQRRADRRHRSQQAHGAADACLRNGSADERHRQGHHDRRAEALHRAGNDQHPELGSSAARNGCDGEHADAGEHEPTPPQHIAQAADADDERGDRKQVGQHDPLHGLERGGEHLHEGGQADVGDAGTERGQQHGQREADQRPGNPRRRMLPGRTRCVG